MYSAGDLPKEGLPHSDICGSTIARISPQLFAACHVLHRLLAPRHPPNALVSLAIPTPAARTQDQTAPRAPTCQDQAASLYAYQRSRALFLNQSQMHNFNERPTALGTPAKGSGTAPGRIWKHATPRPRPGIVHQAEQAPTTAMPRSDARCPAAFRAALPRENGGERIRTDDPLLAKQVLYQLSYAPTYPTAAEGAQRQPRLPRQCRGLPSH